MDTIAQATVVLPKLPADIMVLTDMHIGSRSFLSNEFEHCVNKALREHLHVLCLGDVYDVATRDSKTPPADQAIGLHEAIGYAREWFGKLGRAHLLDGIVRGNHPERLYAYAGIHLEDDLAEVCGAPVLGDCGVVFYEVASKDRNRAVFSVFCHHTVQGGRTAGASLNAVANLMQIVEGCDYYLGGHTHALAAKAAKRYQIYIKGNGHRMVSRTPWLVCCGSFLQYVDSYASAKQLPPSPPGYAILHLRRRDGDRPNSSAEIVPL